jgi:NodT family efflux transporter outer membrane factor (OMF) lipoprotein
VLSAPPSWSAEAPPPEKASVQEDWWRALGDPAIDTLVGNSQQNSPSIAQAVARVAEAEANLGVSRADRYPQITASAAYVRGQQANTTSANGKLTELYSAATVSPSLSWEIDLFGRVRENVAAARSRLDARTADARAARLTLASNIADTVIALRACQGLVQIADTDRDSRSQTLQLTTLRQRAGFATAAELARLQTSVASAQTTQAAQQQACAQYTNALVALSGQDVATVRQLTASPDAPPGDDFGMPEVWLPQAPAVAPKLPATVLAEHPAMLGAMKDVQAAWADIGVARAERLPRLDLAAALTDEWISALGTSLHYLTWSVGPSLGVTVFDGGAGAARVSAAQARYDQALASLQGTLRSTVQDVENALAAEEAAKTSRHAAEDALSAARIQLRAAQAQLRVGASNQIDFEDIRRQALSAQQMALMARRDQLRAWVALMKASGASVAALEPHHE